VILGRSHGAFRTSAVARHDTARGRATAAPPPIPFEDVSLKVQAREDNVTVLLSTFNGADFLESQIASILGQTWPRLRLVIRDGGSTDGTPGVLRMWRRDPRVLAVKGRNAGAKTSFLGMLGLVDEREEIVAFSGHGDLWHPEKIARGVKALAAAGAHRPALYCSRGFLTDRALNVTGATPLWPRPPSFGNALVENIATGCTILLNGSAVAALRSAGAPEGAISHDWWSYLVVSALGTVIFDPRPSVLLRRHDANLAGVPGSSWRRLADKAARPFRQDNLRAIVDQTQSFLAHFGGWPSLPPEHRETARALARSRGLAARALAADPRIERQFPIDGALFRLRVLAGPWPRIL